jgi:hypothetical protein
VLGRIGDEDLAPAPPPPRDRVAVQDRAQVGLGPPVAHLGPAQGDLDQRGLGQVLGQVPVAADQIGRADHAQLARLGERGEVRVRTLAHGTTTSHGSARLVVVRNPFAV